MSSMVVLSFTFLAFSIVSPRGEASFRYQLACLFMVITMLVAFIVEPPSFVSVLLAALLVAVVWCLSSPELRKVSSLLSIVVGFLSSKAVLPVAFALSEATTLSLASTVSLVGLALAAAFIGIVLGRAMGGGLALLGFTLGNSFLPPETVVGALAFAAIPVVAAIERRSPPSAYVLLALCLFTICFEVIT